MVHNTANNIWKRNWYTNRTNQPPKCIPIYYLRRIIWVCHFVVYLFEFLVSDALQSTAIQILIKFAFRIVSFVIKMNTNHWLFGLSCLYFGLQQMTIPWLDYLPLLSLCALFCHLSFHRHSSVPFSVCAHAIHAHKETAVDYIRTHGLLWSWFLLRCHQIIECNKEHFEL